MAISIAWGIGPQLIPKGKAVEEDARRRSDLRQRQGGANAGQDGTHTLEISVDTESESERREEYARGEKTRTLSDGTVAKGWTMIRRPRGNGRHCYL
jgi:hypothetical protein